MASSTTFALGFQIDSALQIRTATEPFEISQLRAVLDAEHYLKAGRPAGHVIWQGVYEHDPEDSSENLVAVLCWAGAAERLKDRDTWIGWDAVTCANRPGPIMTPMLSALTFFCHFISVFANHSLDFVKASIRTGLLQSYR